MGGHRRHDGLRRRVTLCSRGTRDVDRQIEDPAGEDVQEVRRIRYEIGGRVSARVAELHG